MCRLRLYEYTHENGPGMNYYCRWKESIPSLYIYSGELVAKIGLFTAERVKKKKVGKVRKQLLNFFILSSL